MQCSRDHMPPVDLSRFRVLLKSLRHSVGPLERSVYLVRSRIPWLLFRIHMPNDIIWQPVDTITRPLCHFGEALRLGLVLESIARKVDARPMHVSLHNDADAADAVERNLKVFIFTPVALESHMVAEFVGFEVLVAFSEDEILVSLELGNNFESFGGFLP